MDVRLGFCSRVCDWVYFNLRELVSVNVKLMDSSQHSVSMRSQREQAKILLISRYISLVRSELHYNSAKEPNKSQLQQALGFCTIFCIIYRLASDEIKFGKFKKWKQSSKLVCPTCAYWSMHIKAVLYCSFPAEGYLVSAVCETIKLFLSKKTHWTMLTHGNCCEAAGGWGKQETKISISKQTETTLHHLP